MNVEQYLAHTGFGRGGGVIPRRQLGDFWQDLQSAITATPTVIAVLKDPAFSEFAAQIERIRVANAADAGDSPLDLNAGVGLGDVLPYVKAYAWFTENRWSLAFILVAAIGIPVGLGFLIGRWTA